MSVLRRVFTVILVLVLLLTLSGFQCKHEWTEADCLTPETCAVCGLTQGEALGHIWKGANYQDPETCTICGTAQGKPLEADFEKYGLEINLWENKHYTEYAESSRSYYIYAPEDGFPYVTSCYSDITKKTTGALYLCNYRIFQSNEIHQAVDGYEWRAFDVEIEFSGENAYKYGIGAVMSAENYYAIADWDNSESDLTGTQWEYLLDMENLDSGECRFVSFHGEMLPVAILWEGRRVSNWGTVYYEDGTEKRYVTYSTSLYACVPTGYDGVVICFRDGGKERKDGLYVYDVADENTLFFRLDDQR